MSRSKDALFGRKQGEGLGNWRDESTSFLGELCNEPDRNDIDDYLYEEYRERERLDDDD